MTRAAGNDCRAKGVIEIGGPAGAAPNEGTAPLTDGRRQTETGSVVSLHSHMAESTVPGISPATPPREEAAQLRSETIDAQRKRPRVTGVHRLHGTYLATVADFNTMVSPPTVPVNPACTLPESKPDTERV